MQTCGKHWKMFRDAVEARGMSGLVAKDGNQAVDNVVEELQGGDPPFDPLMALNNHFWGEGLRCGGLYLMGNTGTDENGGHYCPVCEFEKNSEGFVAKEAIGSIADQMADYARSKKLIPAVS